MISDHGLWAKSGPAFISVQPTRCIQFFTFLMMGKSQKNNILWYVKMMWNSSFRVHKSSAIETQLCWPLIGCSTTTGGYRADLSQQRQATKTETVIGSETAQCAAHSRDSVSDINVHKYILDICVYVNDPWTKFMSPRRFFMILWCSTETAQQAGHCE